MKVIIKKEMRIYQERDISMRIKSIVALKIMKHTHDKVWNKIYTNIRNRVNRNVLNNFRDLFCVKCLRYSENQLNNAYEVLETL